MYLFVTTRWLPARRTCTNRSIDGKPDFTRVLRQDESINFVGSGFRLWLLPRRASERRICPHGACTEQNEKSDGAQERRVDAGFPNQLGSIRRNLPLRLSGRPHTRE